MSSALEPFLEALASREATPGGGGAAALIGAVGAALTSMVCQLTIGKKQFAAVEEQARALLHRAEAARQALQAAIGEDEAAFGAVMAAYRIDRGDPARPAAIQDGLRRAAAVPLACARQCEAVIAMAAEAAAIGNPAVLSDAGVAALAAGAALRAARLNVLVNARLIEDRGVAEALVAEVEALVAAAADSAIADAVAMRLRDG